MTVIHLLTIVLALALGIILGYSLGYTDAEQESDDREPELNGRLPTYPIDGSPGTIDGSPLIDRGRGEHW